MSNVITLYSFPVSHYVEKVRWAMDYSGIEYRVIHWVPMFHIPMAHAKAGARTLPFIETEQGVVHDSTNIIEWLAAHRDPSVLMPSDPTQRAAAMVIEDLVDNVGFDIIRYMYSTLLEAPDHFAQVWSWNATPRTRYWLKVMLPLFKRVMAHFIGFSAEDQAQGLERLHEVFSKLDDRLADGREFLVGNKLSIADISAASILASILTPPEHPVYSSEFFAPHLAEKNHEFEHYRSYAWMRGIYQQYRGESFAELRTIVNQ